MDLSKFTRDELDHGRGGPAVGHRLLFLPWYDLSVGIGAFHVSATSSATGSPDG
jgi:hypothetical protein